jgi:hypothetical protein
MRSLIESIALENFRSSGFITRPRDDRHSQWQYLSPPRSPYTSPDTVHSVLERRERALSKLDTKPSFLKSCLHAFLRR